jgi:hypothetical protein
VLQCQVQEPNPQLDRDKGEEPVDQPDSTLPQAEHTPDGSGPAQ